MATEPSYFDIEMPASAAVTCRLPRQHAAFAYAYEGVVRIGFDEGAERVTRGGVAAVAGRRPAAQ